jgi:hypothetical protein
MGTRWLAGSYKASSELVRSPPEADTSVPCQAMKPEQGTIAPAGLLAQCSRFPVDVPRCIIVFSSPIRYPAEEVVEREPNGAASLRADL